MKKLIPAIICLFLTVPSQAKTIYADANATGANTGSSWTDAYNYLQDALAAASSGDEIRAARGTYKPDQGSGITPGNQTVTFQLKNGVAIKGGYAGGGTPDPNARDIEAYETILSGDLNGDDVGFTNNEENSYHVVTGSGTIPNAILDGFAITAGNANGGGIYNYGGGMYTYFGSPTVSNCTFSGNSAVVDGGGMYNYYYSSPTVNNCTFSGNVVNSTDDWTGGGGMCNYYFSSPTVNNCTFSGNVAIVTGEWTGGGGMSNYYYSDSIVTDCNFSENTTISPSHLAGGGGIANFYSNTTVNNCRFRGNSANNGGGIVNVRGIPTITNCMFIGNAANLSGGGVTNLDCSPTLTNCEFIGNSASFGGGISNSGQNIKISPVLINCTFSANVAHFNGGGMYNGGLFHNIQPSQMLPDSVFGESEVLKDIRAMDVEYYTFPTLTNCTFSRNEALDFGGGIDSEYDSNPILANCILWGNKSSNGAQIAIKQNPDAGPSNLAISYSAVQGGQAEVYIEGDCTLEWDSNSIISDDPLFMDPDGLDNEIGTEDDNLRLLFGSPCIDAANNEADTDANTPGVQALPLIDLDGNPRFAEDPNVPDTGNGTPPIVDMGAYEGAKGTVLIVLSTESVTVEEGQTATFDVNLGIDPQGPVEVAVAHQSGDSDIAVVSGTLLTFNSSNYWVPQTVTLAAAEDADYLHGTAVISVVVPAVVSTSLTAIELDNEPAPSVLFVDFQAIGVDDGSSWTDAFRDLQAALEIARSATGVEEIRVAAGTYTPAGILGDRNATFELLNNVALYGGFPSGGGEWAERDPNVHGTILSGDLNGNDVVDGNNADNSYHVVTGSGVEPNAILDGFTVTAGNANGLIPHLLGGGMYNFGGSPTVTNCRFSGNSAVFCGGMYNDHASPTVTNCTFIGNSVDAWGGGMYNYESSVILTNCTFSGNSAAGFYGRFGGGLCCESSDVTLSDCNITNNSPDGAWMGYGNVQIDGTVQIANNNLVGNVLILTGDGTLQIDPNSTLDLDNSTISCNLFGTGNVDVDFGSELVIEGNAIIDLGHATDPNQNGRIQCNGLLLVRGSVHLINTRVIVTRASFEGDVDISNSIITAEAGAPYGQFFVEDTVHITGNDIHADGDRYIDLDPAVFAGLIANNRIFITITEGVGQDRGGLLELRGDPNFALPPCEPNEFFCQLDNLPVFDTNSWTIERLELVEGAKVNLTNRFDFGNGGLYEVMYVKNLILGPNSLLNTAFNQLYYKSLDGDPNSVRNEPLLGFSLNNIAFDNENEFITRVMHNNFIDPNTSPPDYTRIHVERIDGNEPDPNGMMRMCNLVDIDPNSPSYQEVINARAKGLFAKASEDEIVILFEYLFGTSDPNTELVVYLSDVPELLDHDDPDRFDHYVEVARLSPPPEGRYGSAGSGHFGVFEKMVSTGDLNFIRGVRMELELVEPAGKKGKEGTETSILINNWDPFVSCIFYCGDVTGDDSITVRDYLTVLGEYGKLSGYDDCLNGIFSGDGYVNTTDLMGVDWLDVLRSAAIGSFCFDCLDEFDLPGFGVPVVPCVNEPEDPLAAMFASETASSSGPLTTGLTAFEGSLLIAGKRFDTGVPDFLSDRLYGFNEDCNLISGPFAMDNDRLNGRLVRDYEGVLYQLNLEEGLVRLSDGNSVIPRDQGFSVTSEPRNDGPAAVYVGFQGQLEDTWGRPIMDAAFDSEGDVYITPVVVVPDSNEPYVASAKLELAPGETPPYHVVQIYDDPPLPGDNQEPNNLREIEVDEQGKVYTINNCYTNNSDILRVYDSNGQVIKTCELQNLSILGEPNGIYAPIGLCCSRYDNSRLYLASSASPLGQPDADSTSLYIVSKEDLIQASGDPNVQTVDVNGMGHITDITEDPLTGTLWVVGFTEPGHISTLPGDLSLMPQFYQPYLANVPYDSNTVEAVYLSDSDPNNDLGLPMSIVWSVTQEKCGGADLDADDDVDFIDLAMLAQYWGDDNCAVSNDCGGADLHPEDSPDGDVDIADLAVLVDYWLETGCN
ncbi:MAG: hypothetical protein ACYS6W_04910 [Planctomycetota bacterium]|jgi:hypothetical protein